MPILHGLRSARHVAKGYLFASKIVKDINHPPKVLTNRIYVGLRLIDLFGHVNNAKYIELMELSRWEISTASGFNQQLYKNRIFPVVANVHVNYFRELKPFQVATVQTLGLGVTAKGNQFVAVQHIYDHKTRLCATGIFHVSLLSWTTNKPLKIRDAMQKLGVEEMQKAMLILEGDDNPDISVENVQHFLELAKKEGGMHLSDFYPKVNEHISTHPVALGVNVEAAAYLTDAVKYLRGWFRPAKEAEGKSETKK